MTGGNLLARLQGRFDFASLDTEAANLELLVATSGVVIFTMLVLLEQVTCAVGTDAAAWQGYKALGGQARTIQIAQGQSGTFDIQFADFACVHGLPVVIQQVQGPAIQRFADRDGGRCFEVLAAHPFVGGMHCGFGDAIHVDQGWQCVTVTFDPRTQDGSRQRFAAEYHIT